MLATHNQSQTTPMMRREPRRSSTHRLALGATWLSIMAFMAITTAFHFLRTDIDPLRRGVSRYQWGQQGLLMSLAFLALAIAFGCTGRIVRQVEFVETRYVAALLRVAAAGCLIVALIPLPETPPVLENMIHQFGGAVTFVASIAGMWTTPRRVAGPFASAVAQTTALAGMVFLLSILSRGPLTGLLQRTVLCGTCLWVVSASWHMTEVRLTRSRGRIDAD
jgi:hypothetical protein